MTNLRAIIVVLLLWPGLAAAGDSRITGSADVGFDSFQERYSIIDSDTLDSIKEFRSRLSLGYKRGSVLDDFMQFEARTMIGEDGLDYSGAITLIERLTSRTRIGFGADLSHRAYRDNSAYEFANDYSRYYLRGYGRWQMTAATALRLTERMEGIDYDRRTDFDYNYVRNTVDLDLECDWNLTNFVTAGLSLTTMSIPDTTEIQYRSWSPRLEVRLAPEHHLRLSAYADVERRRYDHEPARSSFWSLLASATGEFPLGQWLSVEGRNHTEYYRYDSPNDVYFDYTEARNALLLRYNPSWDFSVGAGPTAGFFVSPESPDDEYTEWGIRLAVDALRGTRLWMSASYERGRRGYDAYDPDVIASVDVPAVYSDYTYHRVNLIGTLRLGDGVSLTTLLDYQPEDHEREGDDATATLFSVSLTYAF
jgi:hypothetical protein